MDDTVLVMQLDNSQASLAHGYFPLHNQPYTVVTSLHGDLHCRLASMYIRTTEEEVYNIERRRMKVLTITATGELYTNEGGTATYVNQS